MNLGFELEFAASIPDRNAIERTQFPTMFSLGGDNSAALPGMVVCEMRAGIFTQGFPANKFKTMLEIIKRNNGVVHPTCGFHIHFSNAGIMNPAKMMEFLNKRRLNWISRKQWCGGHWGVRYAPFRQVLGDHYEIRVFNATLKLRGLEQMFRIAERAIEESREGSR